MHAARFSPGRWKTVLVALAVVACSLPVTADELVVFTNGRTLRVAGARLSGGMWHLDHGGGNVLRVPPAMVDEIRVIPEPPRVEPDDPEAWRERAGEYAGFIDGAAREYALAPELLVAVALVESRFDPFAESEKGALGVMQIMPATADELGLENPFDAGQNIVAGARFLREMLDLFDDDLDLALAAYNAGQGTVRRYGGVPPYRETRDYLRRVHSLVARLRGGS